jgi:hypothetical protein
MADHKLDRHIKESPAYNVTISIAGDFLGSKKRSKVESLAFFVRHIMKWFLNLI